MKKTHLSSCAIYNEPALPKGICNCGVVNWYGIDLTKKEVDEIQKAYGIKNHKELDSFVEGYNQALLDVGFE